jgi:hypothetical protein
MREAKKGPEEDGICCAQRLHDFKVPLAAPNIPTLIARSNKHFHLLYHSTLVELDPWEQGITSYSLYK